MFFNNCIDKNQNKVHFQEGGVKCGLRFPTRKAINDHKRKEEHIKRKKKENAGNGENEVDDDLEIHEN